MNPNELHFNDPFFYEQVYAGSTPKTNKDPYNASLSGLKTAAAVTLDHDHHRRRRSYVANFFSKQSTLRRESFLQAKVNKLVQRLQEAYHHGETITAVHAFGALTTDVISHYAYGESFGELDVPGLPSPLTRDVRSMLLTGHFRRFLPVVTQIMEQLPERWLKWLSPAMGTFLDLNHRIEDMSIAASKQISSRAHSEGQKTIFDALTDPSVPPEEQTLLRLKDESILLIFAGLDTTSRFLTAAVCYMATYPYIMTKLRAELKTLNSSQPTLSQLEALPYLVSVRKNSLNLTTKRYIQTAFINETLRYQCSMTGHFPRVLRQPLAYKELLIPSGVRPLQPYSLHAQPRSILTLSSQTTIGARPLLLNNHPAVFPNPLDFRPERWLEAEAKGVNLTKYLFTFSKGSRICLGIPYVLSSIFITYTHKKKERIKKLTTFHSLAYAELYLTISAMVRNFDIELVNSSMDDIVVYRDFAMSFNEKYGFGVDFRITGVVGSR
jgi:cytochrome P450